METVLQTIIKTSWEQWDLQAESGAIKGGVVQDKRGAGSSKEWFVLFCGSFRIIMAENRRRSTVRSNLTLFKKRNWSVRKGDPLFISEDCWLCMIFSLNNVCFHGERLTFHAIRNLKKKKMPLQVFQEKIRLVRVCIHGEEWGTIFCVYTMCWNPG